MLQADKSRRIMLRSAQAIMVRQVEAEEKVAAFVARDTEGLRMRMRDAGSRMRNWILTHQVNTTTIGSYIDISCPSTGESTNELPVPPPKQNQEREKEKYGSISTGTARHGRWIQMQSRSEKTILFKDGHWNNAGASRLLGQECDDTQATRRNARTMATRDKTGRLGEIDRSPLVAFYCSAS